MNGQGKLLTHFLKNADMIRQRLSINQLRLTE